MPRWRCFYAWGCSAASPLPGIRALAHPTGHPPDTAVQFPAKKLRARWYSPPVSKNERKRARRKKGRKKEAAGPLVQAPGVHPCCCRFCCGCCGCTMLLRLRRGGACAPTELPTAAGRWLSPRVSILAASLAAPAPPRLRPCWTACLNCQQLCARLVPCRGMGHGGTTASPPACRTPSCPACLSRRSR